MVKKVSYILLTKWEESSIISYMGKKTITYEIETNLPEWATPEALKALKASGKTLRELGKMAGVSYETIRQQILKAKES